MLSEDYKLSASPNECPNCTLEEWTLIIFKNGKEIFRASNQTGQPNVPLHAFDGFMEIPVEQRQYVVEIPVYGSSIPLYQNMHTLQLR
jgi:hypothetical protein